MSVFALVAVGREDMKLKNEQTQAIECVYDEQEWLPPSKLCLCTHVHVKLAHPHYYCLNYVEEAHMCTCNLFFTLRNEARCYGGSYLNCTKLNIHVIAEAATTHASNN